MAASNTNAAGFGGVLRGAFGSNAPPQAVMFEGGEDALRRARRVGNIALNTTASRLPDFYTGFDRGTEIQRGLQDDQADLLRGLTQRALSRDPQQQLLETGKTLFSFIDPNVIAPLAKFDVNYANTMRRARGLNPSAFDSTADRLRNARIASGRYYDVARDVYSRLPQAFQQVRDAGITDEMLAAGYNPAIQAGYRAIDMAPLIPLREGINIARAGFGIPTDLGSASRALTYGFQQPMNWADRAGAAGESMWNTVKDAAQIYASLYGGGIGGMGGGATQARPPAGTLPAAGSPYYTGYPSAAAYA